jgi:hypothetical protein
VALAGVLGVVLYTQLAPGETGPASAPSNEVATQAAGSAPVVADVKLELLEANTDPYTVPKRDPFRFRAKPEPPPPPPVRREAVLPPGPPPPPPGPPPPPPIGSKLRVLGIMVGESGRRVASLSDGTSAPPILAMQGDVVLGMYRVLRVDTNAVEMAYADGSGARARIPLPESSR